MLEMKGGGKTNEQRAKKKKKKTFLFFFQLWFCMCLCVGGVGGACFSPQFSFFRTIFSAVARGLVVITRAKLRSFQGKSPFYIYMENPY